jgi:hypothetical protein
MTYIEQIIKEEKLRGAPGTGRYNIVKPLEEVKKELEELSKRKVKFCYLF